MSYLCPAGPHTGCRRLNPLLEAQVPLPIQGQGELNVVVTAANGTPSGSHSEGGRMLLLEAQPELLTRRYNLDGSVAEAITQ